ncbi:hypothetical protein THAOC_35852 [Thalassiosira oceanica]|uniref:SGNH domain-containing protein n=1 Tax=Thalassiosira oceanica TaxID=159749 RepID=K0RG09_THAOC|nr:hypothetical protein THAOC_35852 [Thalassiosira oceanica]|eukprot:EJK45527.1 hypothetical protein THAOC_35852 [Thalassiosira oceanica]
MRRSVLTAPLLESGFRRGRSHAARRLALRMAGVDSAAEAARRPIQIAVFGNSFTIGSNCGESTVQPPGGERGCAWPSRLARRWDEVFNSSGLFDLAEVNAGAEWRMYQENAQGSVNIAQKLPSVVDEYRTKGADPDVILLDNTITDAFYGPKPWFEALVRALLGAFPDAVVVSLRDAKNDMAESFPDYLDIVRHYGLASVDLVRMVGTLRSSRDEPYASLRRRHPGVDLLWPQVQRMVESDGTACGDGEPACPYDHGVPCYWDGFLPRVEKTQCAYYPNNHPPWPTHQYVADSVMYALLRTIEYGSGCADDGGDEMPSSPAGVPEETVAERESVEACFICREPVDGIDARSDVAPSLAANATDDVGVLEGRDEPIWRWNLTYDAAAPAYRAVLVGVAVRRCEQHHTLPRPGRRPADSVGHVHEEPRDFRRPGRDAPRGGQGRRRRVGPVLRPRRGGGPRGRAPGLGPRTHDSRRTVTLFGHRESHSLWDAAVFPRRGRGRRELEAFPRAPEGDGADEDGGGGCRVRGRLRAQPRKGIGSRYSRSRPANGGRGEALLEPFVRVDADWLMAHRLCHESGKGLFTTGKSRSSKTI